MADLPLIKRPPANIAEIRMPSIEAALVLSTTKCHAPLNGGYRDIVIKLIKMDESSDPSWEYSATKGHLDQIAAINRKSLALEAGLSFILDKCLHQNTAFSTPGTKKMSIQSSHQETLQRIEKFDPKEKITSSIDLRNLNVEFIIAKEPSVINLGTDDEGVIHTLLPVNIISEKVVEDGNDKEFTKASSKKFVLRKTYTVAEDKFNNEEFISIKDAAEHIRLLCRPTTL